MIVTDEEWESGKSMLSAWLDNDDDKGHSTLHTGVSKKSYNILVCSSLWNVYHLTEVVQAVINTHNVW